MNRPKIAGTRFERAVCTYLEPWFPHVERQCLRGNQDRGDLLGVPGWSLELKAEKKLDPTTALKEAAVAARNSGAPWHAAILKRPRRGIGDALVVMTLTQWAELVVQLWGSPMDVLVAVHDTEHQAADQDHAHDTPVDTS